MTSLKCCDGFQVVQVQIPGIQGGKGDTGKDGKTPSISVDAKTLPEGSEATVTREGSDEEPSFLFGIPRGDKGEKGEPGSFSESDVIDQSQIDNLFGA